jgi:formate dehydrogenase iron-sulfur subunit
MLRRRGGDSMAIARVGLVITPEICIGCRACQVACKSWNQLPGDKTVNSGTYENPSDLTPHLYNRIRYIEVPSEKDPLRWLFVNQRCMHCADAGCMTICPSPGAFYRTAEGAVAFNKEKCIGCRFCSAGCPFDVPRYDEKGKIAKCHLCADRIANKMTPACAKVCPTGAIKYGPREELIAAARKRGYPRVYGETDLGGLGSVYAFREAPKLYGYNENPEIPGPVALWRGILKPLSYASLGGVVAAAIIHYLVAGPHKEEGEGI